MQTLRLSKPLGEKESHLGNQGFSFLKFLNEQRRFVGSNMSMTFLFGLYMISPGLHIISSVMGLFVLESNFYHKQWFKYL